MDDAAEEVISRFIGHGYLDDAKLAEQLIHVAIDRKGQGRGAMIVGVADGEVMICPFYERVSLSGP